MLPRLFLNFSILMLFIIACQDDPLSPQNKPIPINKNWLKIDDNFDYKTTRHVKLEFSFLDSKETPIYGARFDIMRKTDKGDYIKLAACISQQDGLLVVDVKLPASITLGH